MFSRPSHLFLLLWILLLPTNQAVGSIITIDDHHRNIRWMFWESQEKMTFPDATFWIEELIAEGYSDWTMPLTPDGECEGWCYNATDPDTRANVTCSDLGHLYYTVKAYDSTVNSTLLPQHSFWLKRNNTDTVPFPAQEDSTVYNLAWAFDFSTGLQFLNSLNSLDNYALAMRTEPLPTSRVPEPNTALLFLTGILCFTYRPLSRKQLR